MTPPLNNAYLSSHSSLEKSGVHFGILGTFCVGSIFQNERFSKTPNTAMYTFAILVRSSSGQVTGAPLPQPVTLVVIYSHMYASLSIG